MGDNLFPKGPVRIGHNTENTRSLSPFTSILAKVNNNLYQLRICMYSTFFSSLSYFLFPKAGHPRDL